MSSYEKYFNQLEKKADYLKHLKDLTLLEKNQYKHKFINLQTKLKLINSCLKKKQDICKQMFADISYLVRITEISNNSNQNITSIEMENSLTGTEMELPTIEKQPNKEQISGNHKNTSSVNKTCDTKIKAKPKDAAKIRYNLRPRKQKNCLDNN